LKPIPVLTEQQMRNMLMVTMVGMAGYAATTATAMTFAEYLTLIVTRAAGVASSFIIIPPGVLEEFRRSNGMGNSGPPMI
jgi:hypothetical protein